MDEEKLKRADALVAQALALRKDAFHSRPLPDHWRVGDRIRYIRAKDHCCDVGALGTIVETSPDCAEKNASEYQVFWTRPDTWATTLGGVARFWTTPDEVELAQEPLP